MLLQITRYLRNQIFLIISAKKRENVVECKNQQGRNKIIRGGGIVVTCKRVGGAVAAATATERGQHLTEKIRFDPGPDINNW
jgi:hypothetical protein